MFDFLPDAEHDENLAAIKSFFNDYGHELAEAAAHVGGALAEARVVDLALRVDRADRIVFRIRADLKALHRLLSLQTIADPLFEEDLYFATFDPASREIMQICAVTDRLADLLSKMGEKSESWTTSDFGDCEQEFPL